MDAEANWLTTEDAEDTEIRLFLAKDLKGAKVRRYVWFPCVQCIPWETFRNLSFNDFTHGTQNIRKGQALFHTEED